MTLPYELVAAMLCQDITDIGTNEKRHFGWGGYYKNSIDSMHFDFPEETAPPSGDVDCS